MHFDSLKERSLAEIQRGSAWLSNVCMNHYQLRQGNATYDACKWFGLCGAVTRP